MSQLLIKKGFHSYAGELIPCEACGQKKITNVDRKNHTKRFCEDCTIIRRRIKSLERYHQRKIKK